MILGNFVPKLSAKFTEPPKFVVLESIVTGDKFITSNSPDVQHLADGTLAYNILGSADTIEACQKILWPTEQHFQFDIAKWFTKTFQRMDELGIGISKEGQKMAMATILSKRFNN